NADFNKLFDRDLSSNASAFGFDAGLVYEYRGNLDKFKYIKSNDEKSYDALRRDVSKYIFKIGVSLLDVGMFQFDKPAGVNSFSANINNWDIKNGHYKTLKEFDTALAARVFPNQNDPRTYNVYLPTALSAQLDIKFVKGLFLNVMSYWPMSLGSKEGQRFNKYSFYTITPRYETRHFGIYIPYTVTQQNDFTDFRQHLLGLTLRLGPLFIGSSNLGSMLFKENLRTADVHVGLKVGFTYGKPNKSNKFLGHLFAKNQEVEYTNPNELKNDYSRKSLDVEPKDNKEKAITKKDDNRGLILDYKTQKVYDNPDVKQNLIVINNNYYYGKDPVQVKSDTITVQSDSPVYNEDIQRVQAMEITRLQNKKIADSIYKVTKDSLQIKRIQLDSLIRSMQRLKVEMDSHSQKMDSINNAPAFEPTATKRLKEEDNVSVINKPDSFQKKDLARSSIDTGRDDLSTIVPAVKSVNAPVDSFRNANDSFQRTESLAMRLDTSQKDVVVANLKGVENKSVDVKKKDTLVTGRNVEQNNKDASLITRKEETVESLKTKNAQIRRDAENFQGIQDQNQLYQKYADQSARLGNDIDVLNKRLVATERLRRQNVNYVPVPIGVPYNNSRNSDREVRIIPEPLKIRDTVYIRDTIKIYSKDTVQNRILDTVQHVVKIRETKTDTIKIKEPGKKPDFNYAEMPEDHILFPIGKSDVQSIYDRRLSFIADVLEKNSGLEVSITGHTDATGSKAINEKLSLQRAEAVSFYLMKKGVSAKQIVVKSMASEVPAVSGSNQSARSQNRRVVLKLEKIKN
ncbi:MAG: OmpA family protein, partial [Ginsengibacter sp.]